jgi:hypothetical protein
LSSDSTAVQLVVTKAPVAVKGATITGIHLQMATGPLVITGTNGSAGAVYFVLTSTDVALPLTDWTLIDVDKSDATGSFTVRLPYSASDRGRFYVIESQ